MISIYLLPDYFYDGYEEEIDNYSSFGYLTCCILYLM